MKPVKINMCKTFRVHECHMKFAEILLSKNFTLAQKLFCQHVKKNSVVQQETTILLDETHR